MTVLDARLTTLSLNLADNEYGDWNYGLGYNVNDDVIEIEVTLPTQFTEVSGSDGWSFRATWRGTGFVYSPSLWEGSSAYVSYPVSGTVTSLTLEDDSHDVVYTLSGFSWTLTENTEIPSWSLILDGDDTIRGGSGQDNLHGYNGNDLLEGNEGNDNLFGGMGTDTLDGGNGFDFLDYESHWSGVTLTLGAAGANATAFNQEGNDIVRNIEAVAGGYGGDRLTGNELNNALEGGYGDDTLSGGSGDDTIEGGQGQDSMLGGAGTDTLSFRQAYYGVTVDLRLATAVVTNDEGMSEFASGFENVLGGTGYDLITG